ncbi:MAG: ribosome biogenesis GTPase Der [Verrucomicrobia bacterium]|nr:ribosome biogenesis GTPase Der [Verrucomicrobiota bacterium]MBU6446288.1 ribosome biogenesis GTPase Der [Verrucomicrobiota bacterium]MDE3047528.1 ribosome biogenesis GTPase Der [Verrucomicrobiota bacterium]
MLPKIAIVGRPNVGKSALFNRICQKRISIVDEQEGITRDRLYAEAECFGRSFLLIDTGGIDPSEKMPFNQEIRRQAEIAILEADAVILVVDGQVGPHPLDEEVSKLLLHAKKPVLVAVNKIDQPSDECKIHDFHSLAVRDLIGVSAIQGYQIAEMLEKVLEQLPASAPLPEPEAPPQKGIGVAIVGRANVGKSTLLNALLGEERAIVSPIAGTTRDSVDVTLSRGGVEYVLIDTAGIRRKKAETEVVDKFARIRTDEAIARADVCLLVLDSYEGFTTQEKRIASEIEATGKSCILVFNKWDLMKNFRMEHALKSVREEISFLNHCPALFISAEQGRNLDKIFPLVAEVYAERQKRITTGMLNKFIEKCLQKYHPPLIIGKRLRIYYMTQVEVNPPKFVLFVNNPTLMTESYKKYLINHFRESYGFSGCPLTLELRGKAPPPAAEPRLL